MSLTSRVQEWWFRAALCALLVPSLLYSSVSVDVHVTHINGDDVHTHFTRSLSLTVPHDHHHDDRHHTPHRHPPFMPPCDGERHESGTCRVEVTESTIIVGNAAHLNGQTRGGAHRGSDLLPPLVVIAYVAVDAAAVPAPMRACPKDVCPHAIDALRSTVRLI